jgi:(S)-2-hydroxy-acid oxidase
VSIGRPVLWRLAYAGQNGVESVLNILERELSRTMALAGVNKVADIKRDRLGAVARDGFEIAEL